MSELTKIGSTKGCNGYGAARFAAYILAQRSGADALLDYFEVLGQAKDRDIAFEEVFGLTLDAFETDCERIRRDFTAAKRYAKGQKL